MPIVTGRRQSSFSSSFAAAILAKDSVIGGDHNPAMQDDVPMLRKVIIRMMFAYGLSLLLDDEFPSLSLMSARILSLLASPTS